jgi:septal ring factor EnvC (AmiA/AmiB activator)
LAKASEALVTRLLERSQQISDLQASSLTLNDALTDSRQESDGLRSQLAESETSRKDSEAALTETSTLLDESRRALVDLKQSTDEAHKADQTALERAMASRDWWMYYAVGATAVASLLGLYVVFHTLP